METPRLADLSISEVQRAGTSVRTSSPTSWGQLGITLRVTQLLDLTCVMSVHVTFRNGMIMQQPFPTKFQYDIRKMTKLHSSLLSVCIRLNSCLCQELIFRMRMNCFIGKEKDGASLARFLLCGSCLTLFCSGIVYFEPHIKLKQMVK